MTAAHPEHGLLDATVDDLGAGIAWEQIHRVKPPAPLTCRGCGGSMSAKLSTRGLKFFSHRAAAKDCPSAGETLAHRLLKLELAGAIRDVGWHAELEVPGTGWRADVLATAPDGSRRIAFEAQLASATIPGLRERTATMAAEDVEVCWVTDRDVPWVTHVPSARIRRIDPEARADGALVVVDGHARFEPEWCADRSNCSDVDGYRGARAPCPGHGGWAPGRELPLARFVASICVGTVRIYNADEQIWTRSSRHPGGSCLWVTRQYWAAAQEQRQASERYEAWEANQQHERARHGANIVALTVRQKALQRLTIDWVWNDIGTYPTLLDSSPRFAMGVGVMRADKLHAVICPVASRITPSLAGWFSSAVIVVADEAERARIAAVCRLGQRFHIIDPGPLELPPPSQAISIEQGLRRMFGSR